MSALLLAPGTAARATSLNEDSPRFLRPWVRASADAHQLTAIERGQLAERLAQVFSRLRTGVNLAEYIVHRVDDCLRFVQLNRVA